MRILFVGRHASIAGGAETYQRAVGTALLERGHDLAFLSERRGADPRLRVAPRTTLAWSTEDIGARAALEAAQRWTPDVVFAHGLESPDLEREVLHLAPGMLFAHDYYGTCETGTKRYAFPSVRPCTRTLGAGCLALHYPRRCGGLNPITMFRDYRRQQARRTLFGDYRAICVASRFMEAEYRRHGVEGARLHRLALPPVGVAPDPTPPAREPGSGRILMLGRLTDLKGGAYLVEAAELAGRLLARPLLLRFVGDGPARPRLERQAARLGVAAEFRSWVAAEERNALLRDADLLAMPSVWPEPWGLAGLEAGCVGTPSVAFASGGIPDWLTDGTNGALAPTLSTRALTDAIVRTLSDRARWSQLSLGAWECARRHSLPSHAQKLETILSAVAR